MVPSNLKVLAKFGLCSNCSQKLDECSLARAHKIFARARMLGFSLKFPAVERRHNLHLGNKNWHCKQCFPYGKLGTLGKHARPMNVSGKMLPRFADVYWNGPTRVQSQAAGSCFEVSARFLGAKQLFNKERFQLAENLQSARCSPFVIFQVLAAHMRKLITARARKNKGTARMFANARKDHSISLQMVERPLSMREVPGSIPGFSNSTI